MTNAFSPVIKNNLSKVGATKHWTDIMYKYNKIPFVKPVNTDLTQYVANKAIEGLFVSVAQEEEKIRQDPLSRSTAILKRVFGYVDTQK